MFHIGIRKIEANHSRDLTADHFNIKNLLRFLEENRSVLNENEIKDREQEIYELTSEYYAITGYDPTGMIDESSWFKSPIPKATVERDPRREKLIWENQIQPIVKRHKLDFQYRFFEKDIIKFSAFMVERRVYMVLCSGLDDNFTYENALLYLRNGVTEIKGKGGLLKTC